IMLRKTLYVLSNKSYYVVWLLKRGVHSTLCNFVIVTSGYSFVCLLSLLYKHVSVLSIKNIRKPCLCSTCHFVSLGLHKYHIQISSFCNLQHKRTRTRPQTEALSNLIDNALH
ncbi:hypothetical protein ACJX0J_016043, partial [Zea mays]